MRTLLPVLVLGLSFWSAGCVKGPLVDFGDRDKPFVDIRIGPGSEQDAPKDAKTPGRPDAKKTP